MSDCGCNDSNLKGQSIISADEANICKQKLTLNMEFFGAQSFHDIYCNPFLERLNVFRAALAEKRKSKALNARFKWFNESSADEAVGELIRIFGKDRLRNVSLCDLLIYEPEDLGLPDDWKGWCYQLKEASGVFLPISEREKQTSDRLFLKEFLDRMKEETKTPGDLVNTPSDELRWKTIRAIGYAKAKLLTDDCATGHICQTGICVSTGRSQDKCIPTAPSGCSGCSVIVERTTHDIDHPVIARLAGGLEQVFIKAVGQQKYLTADPQTGRLYARDNAATERFKIDVNGIVVSNPHSKNLWYVKSTVVDRWCGRDAGTDYIDADYRNRGGPITQFKIFPISYTSGGFLVQIGGYISHNLRKLCKVYHEAGDYPIRANVDIPSNDADTEFEITVAP